MISMTRGRVLLTHAGGDGVLQKSHEMFLKKLTITYVSCCCYHVFLMLFIVVFFFFKLLVNNIVSVNILSHLCNIVK